MKTLQVDKPVTSSQPQIGDSKIYSGDPVLSLDAGSQKSRQPPETHYKIYSSKEIPTIRVRLRGSEDGDFVINAADFDSEIHEKINN